MARLTGRISSFSWLSRKQLIEDDMGMIVRVQLVSGCSLLYCCVFVYASVWKRTIRTLMTDSTMPKFQNKDLMGVLSAARLESLTQITNYFPIFGAVCVSASPLGDSQFLSLF